MNLPIKKKFENKKYLMLLIFIFSLALVLLFINFYKKNNINFSKKNIEVNSSVDNISISITPEQKNEFIRKLESIGFWDKNATFFYSHPDVRYTVNSIVINIVPSIENPYSLQKTREGEDIVETGVYFENKDKIVVEIRFGKYALANDTDEKLTERAVSSAWNAVYMVNKYTPERGGGISQEKLIGFIQDMLPTEEIFKVERI